MNIKDLKKGDYLRTKASGTIAKIIERDSRYFYFRRIKDSCEVKVEAPILAKHIKTNQVEQLSKLETALLEIQNEE